MGRVKQGKIEMHTDKVPIPPAADGELDERVLVLAAGGRNGEVLCHILRAAGLSYQLCLSMAELITEVSTGAGAVLLTAQTLTKAALTQLQTMLDQQPHWSDLPLVILVEKHAVGLASQLNGHAQITLLEQPVRSFTLVTALQAALHARRRQYEVRDLHASLEQRVQVRSEQVRGLVTQLTMSEQEERRRISQILHDDLQQRLFSLNFQLMMLRQLLDSEERDNARHLIDEIVEDLRESVQLTRNLSVDLSPPILHNEGLLEASRWLAAQMEQQHGLIVTVEAQGTMPSLHEDLRVLLFQAVRELLFNTVKHAGVATALVSLAYEDDHLRIEVSDQGRGFNIDTPNPPTSQGLLRMGQRIELIGGRMEIRSSPGRGTRTTLYVPLRRKNGE
jgi:signal transduction histidine kinase